MPKGWEVKKLGEVCDVFNGSTPLRRKKEYWDNGTINWFTVDDIRKQGRTIKFTHQKITGEGFKSSSLKLLPINSILLCCTASVGEFAITQVELTTNQQFNGLVVKNEIYLLPKYLFYFSSTLKEKLLNLSRKTTIDFVSMGKVKNISIPLPPLPEQKRIVASLDQAFTAIDQAKANTEKNLKNARELFQSKLQETFANGKLKIDTGEWEEKKLGEVCLVIAGQSPEGKYYNSEGNGLPFHQGKKEFSRKFIGEPVKWTTKVTKEAEENDILMSVRAPVGPINFSTQKICIGRGLAAIRANELIDKEFLFDFLLKNENEIVGNTGAVFNSINKNQIKNISIPVPPLPEQKQIVKNLDAVSTETKKLETIYQQKITCLDELKKSILQKAFNGEL